VEDLCKKEFLVATNVHTVILMKRMSGIVFSGVILSRKYGWKLGAGSRYKNL
jgi:hypothetical protein